MPMIDVKLKHGQTYDEARGRLAQAVDEVRSKFGLMLRQAEWSPGGDAVTLSGPGVRVDLRVDADQVHVSGDIPILGSLIGGSSGLKQLIESKFKKP